jgi:mRNA-degrading endonuclease RelE of RelBE toxin-antitoxin system
VKVKWHPEAEKEFMELEKEVQKELREGKEQLAEKGLKFEKAGPVFDPELGLEAFRLRIDSGKANHRLVFDIDNSCIVIYKVGRRDSFYSQEKLEEVKDRKK